MGTGVTTWGTGVCAKLPNGVGVCRSGLRFCRTRGCVCCDTFCDKNTEEKKPGMSPTLFRLFVFRVFVILFGPCSGYGRRYDNRQSAGEVAEWPKAPVC